MATPTISLSEVAVDEVVQRIAAALRDGGVVLLPTDTVYGLAARPGDPAATDRLFALKGRDADTPLAVLCADVAQALELAHPSIGAAVAVVGEQWWPGPLTLVVPRRPGLELHLGEPATTIGLRVPDHDVVRAVAAATGPIAATSANRHGEPTPSTAAEAADALGPGLALVVDAGPVAARASSVIDATTAPWTTLRDGPVSLVDVLAVAQAAVEGGR